MNVQLKNNGFITSIRQFYQAFTSGSEETPEDIIGQSEYKEAFKESDKRIAQLTEMLESKKQSRIPKSKVNGIVPKESTPQVKDVKISKVIKEKREKEIGE